MGTGATAPAFITGIMSRLASCPGNFTTRKEPTERTSGPAKKQTDSSECLHGYSTRKGK